MCLHLPNVCKHNIFWPNQTRATSYLKVPFITNEDIILTGLLSCASVMKRTCDHKSELLLDGPFSLISIGKGTKHLAEVQTGLEALSVSQIQRTLQALGFVLYFLWGLLHAWDLRRQTFDLYRAFQWPCCISLSSHCVFSGGKGVSPHPSQCFLTFGLECPIYTQKPVHV